MITEALFGIAVALLSHDSNTYSRTLLMRLPQHECWLTSERGRIQVRYEHPGRANQYLLNLSKEKCRGENWSMTAIGFNDDDNIPMFAYDWAVKTPDHMRPAHQYSFMFPHHLLSPLTYRPFGKAADQQE